MDAEAEDAFLQSLSLQSLNAEPASWFGNMIDLELETPSASASCAEYGEWPPLTDGQTLDGEDEGETRAARPDLEDECFVRVENMLLQSSKVI